MTDLNNRVVLVGNIATPDNLDYFVIAVERPLENENDSKQVDFHKIAIGSKFSHRVAEFKKGAKVRVEGMLQNRIYESNGERKYTTEIVAVIIDIL